MREEGMSTLGIASAARTEVLKDFQRIGMRRVEAVSFSAAWFDHSTTRDGGRQRVWVGEATGMAEEHG